MAYVESGLVLGEVPSSSTSKAHTFGLQAMRLISDGTVLEELLKHGDGIQISFGKSMRLAYGEQTMELVATGEMYRHELYLHNLKSKKNLDFVGMFSHNLEVRELNECSQDESLLKLRKGYEILNDQKAASTPLVVDSLDFPPTLRSRRKLSQRQVPVRKLQVAQRKHGAVPMKPSRSPVADSSETNTSKDLQIKLDALRIPLIHLLALRPTSEHGLALKTKATEDMCIRVLQRVAYKTIVGRHWELRDDVYKDLDVWDFPYSTTNERNKAIRNCRAAFTRLKLDKCAPTWDLILPPEQRGRTETVSDVRISKQSASRAPMNPNVETLNDPTNSFDAKPWIEDVAKSSVQSLSKPLKLTSKDPISRLINQRKKKSTTKPKPPNNLRTVKANPMKPMSQKLASNTRIKSAEIIYDSDEDIESEEFAPKKPAMSLHSPSRLLQHQVTKGSLAKNTVLDAENVRVNQKRGNGSGFMKSLTIGLASSSLSLSPPSRSIANPNSQSDNSKASSSMEPALARGSSKSPTKPSLGCSPPINASDADDFSTLSSPFMASNTGSSTESHSPFDSVSNKGHGPRYVPQSVSTLKRKAPGNGSPAGNPKNLGLHGDKLGHLQKGSHQPDEQMVKLARRFKEEYSRYERLYSEAQTITDVHRRKEKIERVIFMHHSLQLMKQRISAGVDPGATH